MTLCEWLLNYNAAENTWPSVDKYNKQINNNKNFFVALQQVYSDHGPFCRLVFDCTLLLMVSHWFPDTLHTVSLLFYCILCSRLLGDGEDRGHGAARLT